MLRFRGGLHQWLQFSLQWGAGCLKEYLPDFAGSYDIRRIGRLGGYPEKGDTVYPRTLVTIGPHKLPGRDLLWTKQRVSLLQLAMPRIISNSIRDIRTSNPHFAR
jgi:hypothetical protein